MSTMLSDLGFEAEALVNEEAFEDALSESEADGSLPRRRRGMRARFARRFAGRRPMFRGESFDREFEDAPRPGGAVDAALAKKNWALALKLAIESGSRDHNDLTNLIFFARHPELPKQPLDPKNPQRAKLEQEWSRILTLEVWPAIQKSAENKDLAVSGSQVASGQQAFWGASGKRFKQLVEKAAKDVDLNPGLLAAILVAETGGSAVYLTSSKMDSYTVGTDDFYESRFELAKKVPAYAKIRWDQKQTPDIHDNDAQGTKRKVQTIVFDSGPDALLATAVYIKYREVRLREKAAAKKGDFDKLSLETRWALIRIAMGAGLFGVEGWLDAALKGRDIMVRKNLPPKAYQTARNATIRVAEAMHLSDWIFSIPVKPSGTQPELESEEYEGETAGRRLEWDERRAEVPRRRARFR